MMLTFRRTTIVLALLGIVGGRSAAAQRVQPSLEVGAATMRFEDSLAASAASFSPGLTILWPRARIDGLGTYTQLGTGTWSTQGSIASSIFTPTARMMSAELEATAGGSARWDGMRTGQSVALARAHFDAANGGLWAGGGGGVAWDGYTLRGLTSGDAGAWTRLGRATLLATVSPTALGDTVRYVDTDVALHWRSAPLEIFASAGVRGGDRLATSGGNARSWGSAAVTLHVTPSVGIVLAGGSYPVDFAQGFPGGRYLTLNLRLSAPAMERTEAGDRLAALLDRRAASRLTGFDVSTMPNGSRVVRVCAPGARSVEIAGDFTDWAPLQLSSSGNGCWVAVRSVAPGTHQLALRIDGGAWEVPPKLLPIVDEFGGVAGIWIVE